MVATARATTKGKMAYRRLSPDSNPIEIAELSRKRDEGKLLHAIGAEAANVLADHYTSLVLQPSGSRSGRHRLS